MGMGGVCGVWMVGIDVTVPNRLMHLYRNGTIYYSMRCVCGVWWMGVDGVWMGLGDEWGEGVGATSPSTTA